MLSDGKKAQGDKSQDDSPSREVQLVAPLRFGCLDPQAYRGSYPQDINMDFLKTLQLKTVLSLTPEPLPELLPEVRYLHIKCSPTSDKSKKKRPVPVTNEVVDAALEILEDPHMRPIYIHCLNGAQITGIISACYRRRQQWSMYSTLTELERYADFDRKVIQFVEDFSKDQTYFV